MNKISINGEEYIKGYSDNILKDGSYYIFKAQKDLELILKINKDLRKIYYE